VSDIQKETGWIVPEMAVLRLGLFQMLAHMDSRKIRSEEAASMSKELVTLTLRVRRDEPTDQAILVMRDDGIQVWLPRSEIEIEYKDQRHSVAEVTMPIWLAEEKEIE
jgi:hypothetical protein